MQGSFVNLPEEGPLYSFGKHISYNGVITAKQQLRALSGELFGPAGTEIGVTLDHQTALGGVGVMAIGKKVGN